MISDLDKGISRCKKYNEAKINRKYEIIIHDLQAEIRRLQENLKLEQDARSPTKKHISDILEKLVAFRTENQELQEENQKLREKIRGLEGEAEYQSGALLKMQQQQSKQVERLPALPNAGSVQEAVRDFLRDKEQVRKITKNPTSGLEKLLSNLKPRLWSMTVGGLLEEVDRWSDGVKDRPSGQVDMWRVRSSIARTFSDCMDQPQRLMRPSRHHDEPIWSQLERKNQPNSSKFGYLASRRSLNSSIAS